jgi:hypothetical protein
MAGLRGLLPVLLVLGVIFGPDAYKLFSSIGTSPVEVRVLHGGDRASDLPFKLLCCSATALLPQQQVGNRGLLFLVQMRCT